MVAVIFLHLCNPSYFQDIFNNTWLRKSFFYCIENNYVIWNVPSRRTFIYLPYHTILLRWNVMNSSPYFKRHMLYVLFQAALSLIKSQNISFAVAFLCILDSLASLKMCSYFTMLLNDEMIKRRHPMIKSTCGDFIC